MLKSEEIEKIRMEDMKKLEKVNNMADEIALNRRDEIQKRCQDLKNKLQDLIDKKGNVIRSPRSKNEVLALAVEALKEGKRMVLDEVLISHLRNVQNNQTIVLSRESSRISVFNEKNLWKFGFLIITEEDLEKAVQALPDIGLSEGERDARIKKLNAEIVVFEKQIREELEKL